MSCKISSTGDEAQEFARALGVDPRDCYKIELSIAVDELVNVVIYKNVHNTELEALTTILKKYNLVKKEDDERNR